MAQRSLRTCFLSSGSHYLYYENDECQENVDIFTLLQVFVLHRIGIQLSLPWFLLCGWAVCSVQQSDTRPRKIFSSLRVWHPGDLCAAVLASTMVYSRKPQIEKVEHAT